jgi:hypothetical protein
MLARQCLATIENFLREVTDSAVPFTANRIAKIRGIVYLNLLHFVKGLQLSLTAFVILVTVTVFFLNLCTYLIF